MNSFSSRTSLSVAVILVAGGLVGQLACSSSDDSGSSTSSTGGPSTSSSSGGAATGGLTGNCATLKSCCPTLTDSSQAQGCNFAADNSQNNDGVCSDALKSYPTCGGGNASSSSSSSGSSGCGAAGAEPAPIPANCQGVAGACLYHENDAIQHSAQIVCQQYNGQYTQIASSAGTQCMDGNPMHEWKVGMTCAQATQGIQAGCESYISGSSLCTIAYYGQGCVTGGGQVCNTEKSTNGLWVMP